MKLSNLVFFLIFLILIMEVSLRLFLGLGNPPLLEPDDDVGYLYKANQDLYRFRNHVYYNEFHQRSDSLMQNPDYRILIVGDSVTNGGSLVDQSNTISEILEKKINEEYNFKGEVLSASAKSWGLENEYEYLKKFGTFGADLIILQVGTHDLLQPKSTSDSLGTRTHPIKNLPFAILDLLWYGHPEIFGGRIPKGREVDPQLQFDRNLNASKKIIEIAKKEKVPLIVILTPNVDEIQQEKLIKEKRGFVSLLNSNNITHINLLKQNFDLQSVYLMDNVHFNEQGNGLIAEVLFENIKPLSNHWK